MNFADGDALLTKPVLVGLSHAVERFALAADPRDPLVVIALFQRQSYFEREATTYRDIAARGAVTVVGLVEDFPSGRPSGVHHQALAENDSLAKQWSVVVLGPHGGACLVAFDQESVSADAPSFERGRRFRGHWSFRRADACREVMRLREQLRLPAAVAAGIDDVLRVVARTAEPPGQSWWEAPLRSLAADMERAELAHDRARTAGPGPDEGDEITGLPTPAHFERWVHRLGPGTLPVGLVVLRLLDAGDVRDLHGVRVELAAVQAVATCLATLVEGAERLVQLSRHDFLFVLPSAQPARVAALRHAAQAHVERAQQHYPFVALRTAVASTITRDRPLPVDHLLDELEYRPGSFARGSGEQVG